MVLESHSQNLVVGKRLCEGDEAQLCVESIFVGGQQASALQLFIVGAASKPKSFHIRADVVDVTDSARVNELQQVVGCLAVGQGGDATINAGRRCLVLTQVGQCQNVTVVGDGGTDIGSPHFKANNLDVAVDHRQRRHSLVVVVIEVLRDEEVPVLFVFVGTYLEFLCRCAALHLHILGRCLLVAVHSVDGEIAELEFGVDTEQALAALDERRIQRERYIGSLQQLDNIILFALVFQLDLILEIKGCLGVPVDVCVEQVADLGVESQLDVFVKVGLDVAPSCFIDRRVVGEVADYLQRKVGTSAGCNLYLRLVHQAFQLATNLVESGYLAQQAAFAAVSVVLLLLLCPEVVHQVLHLVVLILLKCHKLAADNDAANLGYLDIAVSVGVVLDGGRHIGRVVQIQRALRRRAVGGDGEMQRRPSAVLFLLCLQRNGRHEQQQ